MAEAEERKMRKHYMTNASTEEMLARLCEHYGWSKSLMIRHAIGRVYLTENWRRKKRNPK